jgi:hypothetical protein
VENTVAKTESDRMISEVLSHFVGMMRPSIVEDQHVVFVQLRPQLLQPLQHLVALERAFKTPGRKTFSALIAAMRVCFLD